MSQEVEHIRGARKLVLLVEDDLDIGEVLTQVIMQETAHAVILKTDGPSALAIATTQKPDLLILDFHLPRMTGIELYDRFHTTAGLEDVPTLMISAHLPIHELAKRNITAMDKPVDLDEFLQTIEHLLA